MVICFGSTIQFLIYVIYYKRHRLKTEWFIQKLVKMKIGWRRVISNHGIFHSIFAYFKQKYKGKRNYMWNFSIKIIVKVCCTGFYNSSLCLFIAKRMPFALQFLSILVLVFNNKSANSADWHHKILYKVKIMTNDNIF